MAVLVRFCAQTWSEWEPGHRNPARARWWMGERRCVFAPRAPLQFRKWWVPPGKGHLCSPQFKLCVWTLPRRRRKELLLIESHIFLQSIRCCCAWNTHSWLTAGSQLCKQSNPRCQYRMCILDSILKFVITVAYNKWTHEQHTLLY